MGEGGINRKAPAVSLWVPDDVTPGDADFLDNPNFYEREGWETFEDAVHFITAIGPADKRQGKMPWLRSESRIFAPAEIADIFNGWTTGGDD